MSVFSNVVSKTLAGFRRVETRASKAGRLISMSLVGQAVWTPRRYDELAKESYAKNAVAFRAISEIAKCAGSIPFQLFEHGHDERKEILHHPLLNLIERPNPLQARAAFIQALVGFYLIAGNSYVERVGPRGKSAPRELWTKRPDFMKVKAGPKGIPSSYIFDTGQDKVEWPVRQSNGMSEILHIKSFNPLNHWYGQSPVEAAAYSIDQHNEAGKWNMARLQNDARPSGAFIIDPKQASGLSDEQFERLRQQVIAQTGPDNAGVPLLLEGGTDWKEMGLSPKDMDWLQGKHTSARDIAMVFGMPSQMLGIPGDNTHRNMEEARLWLWEQTIMPLFDFILGEFNWWLTPLFGDNLELVADYDNIPALITRRHTLWDKVQNSDFLTVNEKRKATGYEERPEGDVIRTPKNKIDLSDEEANAAAAGIKKEGDEPEDDSIIPPKPNGKDPDEATQ